MLDRLVCGTNIGLLGSVKYVKARHSSNTSKDKQSPVAIGASIGAIAGVLLFAFSVFAALGICSDTSTAEMLFPYSMMILKSQEASLWPVLIIALIQYPLYGALCGQLYQLKGWTRYLAIPILLLAVVSHCLAITKSQR